MATVALSYCIIVGMWIMPQRAFGLPDEAIAYVAGRICLFPCLLGPLAGISALVVMAIDRECYHSWKLAAAAILGLIAPCLTPAIVTA